MIQKIDIQHSEDRQILYGEPVDAPVYMPINIHRGIGNPASIITPITYLFVGIQLPQQA